MEALNKCGLQCPDLYILLCQAAPSLLLLSAHACGHLVVCRNLTPDRLSAAVEHDSRWSLYFIVSPGAHMSPDSCLRKVTAAAVSVQTQMTDTMIHVCRETVKDCRGNNCGWEVLKATMTQLLLLLLLYTRLLDLLKASRPAGAALVQDAVTVTSILYAMKRFTRT